jgi:hypothetical protein
MVRAQHVRLRPMAPQSLETTRAREHALQLALENAHGNYVWLTDFDGEYVYFAVECQRGWQRQAYSADADGKITLTGEPQRVRPQPSYIPAKGAAAMPRTNATDDDLAERLQAALDEAFPGEAVELVEWDAEHVTYWVGDQLMASSYEVDADQVVVSGPAWARRKPRGLQRRSAAFERHKAEYRAKLPLVAQIIAAPGNRFSETELTAKPLGELRRLASVAGRPLAGSGQYGDIDESFAPLPDLARWNDPPMSFPAPMAARPEAGARLHMLASAGAGADFAPLPPDRYATPAEPGDCDFAALPSLIGADR